MKGISAFYLGRHVSKDNFRAYIYSPDGSQKLVNSWDEFEKHMETGIWFTTRDEAVNSLIKEDVKVKSKRRTVNPKKVDKLVLEEIEEISPILDDDKVFEVKSNDDFLPN